MKDCDAFQATGTCELWIGTVLANRLNHVTSEMYEAEKAMSEKAPQDGMQGRVGTEPGHAREPCLHVFRFPVTTCSQPSRKVVISPCTATFVAKVVRSHRLLHHGRCKPPALCISQVFPRQGSVQPEELKP